MFSYASGLSAPVRLAGAVFEQSGRSGPVQDTSIATKAGYIPAFLLVMIMTLLAGCARSPFAAVSISPVAPADGALFTAAARPLSEADFATLAAGYDYVLLGEGHDSACDHLTQARLIRLLAGATRPPAVGLEMIPAPADAMDSPDSALRRLSAGDIALDDLPSALDWKNVWGYPFSLYQPIFQVIRYHALPAAGLNMDRQGLDEIRKSGLDGLAPERKALLPVNGTQPMLILPGPEQTAMLSAEFADHAGRRGEGKSGRAMLERFLTIQSVWDTVMAEQARRLRLSSGRPVVIVVGAGHVEYGFGIARRLNVVDPQAKTLLVHPWRGESNLDPATANVFFYCPLRHKSRLGYTLEYRDDGLLVTAVEPESKAGSAGLRPGDVLVRLNGEQVGTFRDLHKIGVQAGETRQPLRYEVIRLGDRVGQTEIVIPLGDGRPVRDD